MRDLINDSYNFEKIDSKPNKTKYEFLSIGNKKIPKRVSITKYPQPGLEQYYNLGFGNIFIVDGFESISDMSRDNNSDTDKVLKTVLTCTLDFLSENQDAIITFFGNTAAKHRMYKTQLNKNLEAINTFFIVKGAVLKDIYFLEDDEGRKYPSHDIDIDNIVYEIYNMRNSPLYNFITFELKTELK
ncbi:DUF6934 family protein [Flavobacterium rivuli]|uniref:DUF6934 family protein n=1 Tax=Flavobacterium rivuli TaxID=498301 RepID=UPI00036F54EA|nr:hypothetical protein [Flavobacterium rivuli]